MPKGIVVICMKVHHASLSHARFMHDLSLIGCMSFFIRDVLLHIQLKYVFSSRIIAEHGPKLVKKVNFIILSGRHKYE